ncbi:MAG: hypothetical protein ACTSYE_01640 [Alphaproteobacteria bacterium]
MDVAGFRATQSGQAPPGDIGPALQAMWYAAREDWDRAHGIVQRAGEAGDRDADWVHAYLHRVEGDLSNAGYWYRRAERPVVEGTLDEEWAAVVEELLSRP